MPDDDRDVIYVHTDHNPDETRVFYEVPDAIVDIVRPADDRRTFAQALADLLNPDTDEMVARVARAIHDHACGCDHNPWPVTANYAEMARAAVAAVKERP